MAKLTMSVAKKWVRKNAPSLLMSAGICTYAAGTGLAVYGTVKACNKTYGMPAASKKEIVKAVWPYYIPTTLCFAGGTALCVTANHMQLTRIELLAAAYVANNKKFEVYKDKVKELFGDDADKKISQETSRKRVIENPPTPGSLPVGGENILHCQDSYTGQYFWASRHKVDQAITEIDRAVMRNGQVTVNELLYELGCPESPAGSEVGWDPHAFGEAHGVYKMPSEFIQLNYVKGPNGEPVLVIEYEPKVLLPFR